MFVHYQTMISDSYLVTRIIVHRTDKFRILRDNDSVTIDMKFLFSLSRQKFITTKFH